MLQLIKIPPTTKVKIKVLNSSFKFSAGEPFQSLNQDGTIDDDIAKQTKGFLNRAARYAKANKKPIALQELYQLVYESLGKEATKYFQKKRGVKARANASTNPPSKPLPALPETLRNTLYLRTHAPSNQYLQNASKTEAVHIIKQWIDQNPKADKQSAGPVFWHILHTTSKNHNANMNPSEFVSFWLAKFPCPECQTHFQQYLYQNPPPSSWSLMPQWSSNAHNWVTQNKNAEKKQVPAKFTISQQMLPRKQRIVKSAGCGCG